MTGHGLPTSPAQATGDTSSLSSQTHVGEPGRALPLPQHASKTDNNNRAPREARVQGFNVKQSLCSYSDWCHGPRHPTEPNAKGRLGNRKCAPGTQRRRPSGATGRWGRAQRRRSDPHAGCVRGAPAPQTGCTASAGRACGTGQNDIRCGVYDATLKADEIAPGAM